MSKKSPQLRFEGFTDDWEERKIKDIFKITRGQVLAATETSEEKSDISPFPVYSSQTKNNGLMGYYKDYLFDTAITWTTDGANAGTVSYRSGRFYSTNVNGVLISDKGYTNKAISEILNLEAWKWVSHVGNPKLMNNVMGDISIMIPSSFEEQDRLSDFLNQLDDTIALHQHKLDLLKEQKKGYLQKMFPKNGAKVPELRFAGFADDWEDRKLSSIAERVTRKNKNNESTLPLTISAQDGLVDQNDYFNKQVASRDVTGYFLVKNGEFAYNKSYSNGYPWGAIKRLDKYEMGVLSTLYIVFKPTAINSQFLVSYYETTRWYREVSKNAAEGARNHGLLNISPNDFFNTLLTIPKSAEEQQQIGSFFKQLDDTIALHQHKLDLLKEQKKGFLQKMFV
ncbi:restriction endonuclease subunit S [Lactococcus formosensis]|uniref:restriction endonuclease subunit S n=1 Tax=Lactococcus formosensis TaxID=1281486 RepID=UPI00288E8B89|nr:restriction endonuclease subunit S [Lactococcus formosensis]MDT2727460.1 restriction endonuclease subunit S [Lactococcus formosensis]